MKHIKRMFALVLALALALCFAAPAFAVDITVNDPKTEGATYVGYRLLDAKVAQDAVEDGTDGYLYTVNMKYADVLKSALESLSESDFNSGTKPVIPGKKEDGSYEEGFEEAVLAAIRNLKDNGYEASGGVRAFADAVYKAIQAAKIPADKTAAGKTFTGVEQGYWMIVEEPQDGALDTVASLVMLDTAGDESITVNVKEDVPTSKKKVKEKNDTTGAESDWQNGADYDIGDDVPFQLTGTLPKDVNSYTDGYYLAFHDKMDAGLNFNDDVKVTVNGTDITGSVRVKKEGFDDGCTFEVVIEDILSIEGLTLAGGETVTVDFTAELTKDAVIGQPGNHNESHMVYSNDHYSNATGKTPTDKVTVFTFELIVEKVGNDEETPLAGAGFTLYKVVPDGTEGALTELRDGKGNVVKTGYFMPVEVDEDGNTEVMVELDPETSKYKADFQGLDSGNYVLVETTVPTGYNAAAPVEITVTATYDEDDCDDPQLMGLTVDPSDTIDVNMEKGQLSTKVANHTGVELPSTGGIGTTLFYVIGGILVAGAAILLFTKKRVDDSNK